MNILKFIFCFFCLWTNLFC